MTDIFLSYASEDRPRAKVIADALEAQGWDVWWDREIRAGERFDQIIDRAITEARCIVVLWSRVSVGKVWVLEEAADGRDRGVLVPVQIDEVGLPRGFRRIQAASLVGWDGNTGSAPFRRLVTDIAALMDREPRPPQAPEAAAEAERMTAWRQSQPQAALDRPASAAPGAGRWALAGLLGLALASAAWWFGTHSTLGSVRPPYEVQVTSTATDGVALRRSPRGDAEVIARLLAKSRLSVTGAAVEADAQRWWPARLDPGWIAEGEIDPARPRLLEPVDAEQLQVRGFARVRYPRSDGLNLRQGPNLASPVIAALYKGSIMQIIGTPEHLQGYRWWLVRVPEGWVAEGPPGGELEIRPID